MNKDEIVIGIDLGTTNSEAAVYIDGKIEMITVGEGEVMMPSVVGIDPNGKLIVGAEARNQYALYPENTIRSVKRKMGTNEKLKLASREYLPQEISGMILRKFRECAEAKLGCPVSKAVITVPAQFNDAQRQATRDAGKIAGLEVLRIINEPTAACLAYESDGQEEEKYILAFDLGGGTFDVSLVKIEGDVTEVVASHGNNHLGGDDFDKSVSEWIQRDIYARKDAPGTCSAASEYRLLKAAENAKIHLSEFAYAKILEDGLTDKSEKVFAVDQELSLNEFNEIIHPFVDKTILAVRQCLADARIKANQINDIIMIGGSTRSTVFCETIERELGIRPRNDINPDLAVAYGAGLMAARLMGKKTQQILIDITPYTFGISCLGDLNGEYCPFVFAPIINAGAPLPIIKEKIFYTSYEDQEVVEIEIFQGEEHDSRNNIHIGRFMVEDLSPQPANSPVVVGMRLDLDGVLKVTAIEKSTGKSKHISIENAMAKLSDQQLESASRRLDTMFSEGSDNVVDIEVDMITEAEAGNEFDSASATQQKKKFEDRIAAVDKNMDDVDKADAEKLLARMNSAIETADEETVSSCATELEDILFYLE